MLKYFVLTAAILQLGYCELANIDCVVGIGVDYRGDVAVTEYGRTCQIWDHSIYNPTNKPGRGLEESKCRNPDDDDGGPWCYTTMSWEYCDIRQCASLSIAEVAEQSELAEQTISCVIKDLTAEVSGVEWSTETTTSNTYTGEDGEFADGKQTATLTLSKDQQVALRDAGGDTHTFTCKATLPDFNDPQTATQTITIGEGEIEEKEPANIDCYVGIGVDYRGDVAVTRDGETCRNWDTSLRFKPTDNPGKGLEENQCRNPDDDAGGPWCYAADSADGWLYCDIRQCASLSIPEVAEPSELAEQTISCVIKDLTAEVSGVEWSTETTTSNTYTGEDGEFADGEQTATLTLSKDQQVALREAGGDTHTFTCKATLPDFDDPQTATQTITIGERGEGGEGGEEEIEEEEEAGCENSFDCTHDQNAAFTYGKASWFATVSCIILGVVNCLI